MFNCTLLKSKTYAMHLQTSIRLRIVQANREKCYVHKYSGILWNILEYCRIFWNIPIGKKCLEQYCKFVLMVTPKRHITNSLCRGWKSHVPTYILFPIISEMEKYYHNTNTIQETTNIGNLYQVGNSFLSELGKEGGHFLVPLHLRGGGGGKKRILFESTIHDIKLVNVTY